MNYRTTLILLVVVFVLGTGLWMFSTRTEKPPAPAVESGS